MFLTLNFGGKKGKLWASCRSVCPSYLWILGKERKVVSVLPLSLAQLASMAENMERGGGGGGATQHNFTLADLISNVSEVRDSGV
jgi:hypothetical protein